MRRVTANGRPDEASDLLRFAEQRTARRIRSATFVRAAEMVRRPSASGLFAGRTRRSYSPSLFLLGDDLVLILS